MSKNKQLVLAIFDTEESADAAATAVKAWDKASKAVSYTHLTLPTSDLV